MIFKKNSENVYELPMLIGKETRFNCNECINVFNPANQALIGKVAVSTEKDLEEAVDAAEKAFLEWSKQSPVRRAQILHDAGLLVIERADEIAEMMTLEEGKPFDEARGEVLKGAEILQFYAEEAKRLHGETIPGFDVSTRSFTVYEPVGVCIAISPWNYPVELVAWKLGGAIGAGCTLVIKPPSEAPMSPAAFAQCVIDAGVPSGVVNVVYGKGSVVGPLLIENPKVKKIAFTGSTEAGKKVAILCASHMKKASLELGGHCPMIVTKNACLNDAVKAATRRSFRNNGQICIAINRIYVERPIYDEFIEKFASMASKLVIDDGIANHKADMGPMASKSGLDKTKEHVEDAIIKGAKLVYGGEPPQGKKYENGYFYKPTILADTNHEMLIMTEETFGPAVGVMPFDTLEEVINLANDTKYGLAAYVYTEDLNEADRFISELDSGNVAVNNPDAGVINAPYGGFKESGIGYEHGKAGMMEYVKIKHIRIKYGWKN